MKRLDSFGSNFEQEVGKMKGATTDDNYREESQSENSCPEKSLSSCSDNIDLKILTRDMTAD